MSTFHNQYTRAQFTHELLHVRSFSVWSPELSLVSVIDTDGDDYMCAYVVSVRLFIIRTCEYHYREIVILH